MIILLFLLALPSIPPDYKLQIGDEIAITISGNINFTYSQIVSPEGNVFIQSLGEHIGSPPQSPESKGIIPSGATVLGMVKVLGFTLEEAREVAEKEFKRYFKNISVSLSITKFKDVVYVEGGVVVPGAYPFFPGKTARDYIGLAGGPAESGDIENIRITTPPQDSANENKVIKGNLDFSAPRNSVITVPHAFVYVRGEVTKPGSFPYHPGMDAHQYIGMAGGSTDRANLKRSYVIKRGSKKGPIDKAHIEKGDIIVVKRIFLKWWEDYVAIGGTLTSTIYLFTLIRDAFQK